MIRLTEPVIVRDILRPPLSAVTRSSSAMRSSRSAQQTPLRSAADVEPTSNDDRMTVAANAMQLGFMAIPPPRKTQEASGLLRTVRESHSTMIVIKEGSIAAKRQADSHASGPTEKAGQI